MVRFKTMEGGVGANFTDAIDAKVQRLLPPEGQKPGQCFVKGNCIHNWVLESRLHRWMTNTPGDWEGARSSWQAWVPIAKRRGKNGLGARTCKVGGDACFGWCHQGLSGCVGTCLAHAKFQGSRVLPSTLEGAGRVCFLEDQSCQIAHGGCASFHVCQRSGGHSFFPDVVVCVCRHVC